MFKTLGIVEVLKPVKNGQANLHEAGQSQSIARLAINPLLLLESFMDDQSLMFRLQHDTSYLVRLRIARLNSLCDVVNKTSKTGHS